MAGEQSIEKSEGKWENWKEPDPTGLFKSIRILVFPPTTIGDFEGF